jgi:hypothetical protein
MKCGWVVALSSRRAGCDRISLHAPSGRELEGCKWRPAEHRSAGLSDVGSTPPGGISIHNIARFWKSENILSRAAHPAPGGRGEGYRLLVPELA